MIEQPQHDPDVRRERARGERGREVGRIVVGQHHQVPRGGDMEPVEHRGGGNVGEHDRHPQAPGGVHAWRALVALDRHGGDATCDEILDDPLADPPQSEHDDVVTPRPRALAERAGEADANDRVGDECVDEGE